MTRFFSVMRPIRLNVQTWTRHLCFKYLESPVPPTLCRCLSSKGGSDHRGVKDLGKKSRQFRSKDAQHTSQSYESYNQDRPWKQNNYKWNDKNYHSEAKYQNNTRQFKKVYRENYNQYEDEEVPRRHQYRSSERENSFAKKNRDLRKQEELSWRGKLNYDNKRKYKKSKDPSVTYPEDNELTFISKTISMPKQDTGLEVASDVDVITEGDNHNETCDRDEETCLLSETDEESDIGEQLTQEEMFTVQSFGANTRVDEDDWEYHPDRAEFDLGDINMLSGSLQSSSPPDKGPAAAAKSLTVSTENPFQVHLSEAAEDTFGTLASDLDKWEMHTKTDLKDFNEDREKRKPPLARYNRRHVPHWYARRIQKLGKQGKVREAIQVFDTWMIEQDRVKPTMFEFGCLMTILGHAGYTEKAFALYEQMKETVNHVDGHVYTGLFTACANSPWPEDGLKQARALYAEMCQKQVNINFINYMAMIQAFARLGDVETAFVLAEKAVRRKLNDRQRHNVLCALLTASIADKQSGFRHAVLAWRHIQKLGVKSDIRLYNLLLRAVKECGIGDPSVTLEQLGGQSQEIPLLNSHAQMASDKPSQEYLLDTNKSVDKELPVINAFDATSQHLGQRGSVVRKYRQDVIPAKGRIDLVLEKYPVPSDLDDEEGEGRLDEVLEMDDEQVLEQYPNVSIELASEQLDISDIKEWWEEDIFLSTHSRQNINTSLQSPSDTEIQLNTEPLLPVDILNPASTLPGTFDIAQVKTASDRLNLIGGLDGFLERLQSCEKEGQIVAFTLLLDCVPHTMDDDLMVGMQIAGVNPDTDFFNHLIQKKTKIYHHKDALGVFSKIRSQGLVPNERTFGCTAVACKSRRNGLGLLEEMERYAVEPNIKVLTSLLKSAPLFDFEYTSTLLRTIKKLGHKPDRYTIGVMEHRIEKTKKLLYKQPNNKVEQERLQRFISFYDNWLKYSTMETEEDPWRSFKVKEADLET